MPFVKLDCGILNSTLWIDREARNLFITALLMAEPREIVGPMAQLKVHSLDQTGWEVPPGWYGFVPAAGPGIAQRAGVPWNKDTQAALARLGDPENESRSPAFSGRRLVRVDGGFVVLNYMAYRERDYTGAERQRRFRNAMKGKGKRRNGVTPLRNTVTSRPVTQAEEEAEVEEKDYGSPPNPPADAGGDFVPPEDLAQDNGHAPTAIVTAARQHAAQLGFVVTRDVVRRMKHAVANGATLEELKAEMDEKMAVYPQTYQRRL